MVRSIHSLSVETFIKGIVPRYKGLLPTNEPACAHLANETGRSRWLISSCLVFKSACWGSLCSEFNISSIICALQRLLISILTLWPPIAKDHELLNLIINKVFALYAFNLCILPCTIPRYWACPYMYFLYPLFELMSLLKSNHALQVYHGTLPLKPCSVNVCLQCVWARVYKECAYVGTGMQVPLW